MQWPVMVDGSCKVYKDISKFTKDSYSAYRHFMTQEGFIHWQSGPDPFTRTNNVWWRWGN